MLKFIGIAILFMGSFSNAAAAEQPVAPPCKPKPIDLSQVPEANRQLYLQRAQEIQSMDTNCDDVLEQNELNKSANEKFNAADVNQDGVISESEKAAVAQVYKQETQDQLPPVTANQRGQTLENHFTTMDINKDGLISPQEYSDYYSARYSNQDKNNDGVIDAGEYKMDTETHHHHKKH